MHQMFQISIDTPTGEYFIVFIDPLVPDRLSHFLLGHIWTYFMSLIFLIKKSNIFLIRKQSLIRKQERIKEIHNVMVYVVVKNI